MNELNYASIDASKQLVDVGIVLKTDFYWASVDMENWSLCTIPHKVGFKEYPAPSMAEVWRELRSRGFPCSDGDNWWLCDDNADEISPEMSDTNPTDALIDLLIWVRKEASHADK